MPSHEGISSTNKAFMEAFGKGDAAGVANLYTKAGSVLPPNSEVIGGIEAIHGFWQGAKDMGIKGAKGEVMDRGKYIVAWKDEGGKWKLHRDIWNSSLPTPSK
jgi:ketosteroid isomerase-like protein